MKENSEALSQQPEPTIELVTAKNQGESSVSSESLAGPCPPLTCEPAIVCGPRLPPCQPQIPPPGCPPGPSKS